MAEKTIQDFGEKIGGARKDLWAARGLSVDDLLVMNDAEKIVYATKQNVWPRPDWTGLIENGVPTHIAYWQNEMRKALLPKCSRRVSPDKYVSFATKIRDSVMAVKTDDEIRDFLKDHIQGAGFIAVKPGSHFCSINESASGILDKKLLKASQDRDISRLKKKATDSLFGVPAERKAYQAAKNRLSIYCYDGVNRCFEKNFWNDENHICIKNEGCTSYYYPKGEFADESKWSYGRYFLIDQGSREIVAYNIGTRETAEQMVEDMAQAVQKLQNSGNGATHKDAAARKKAFQFPHLAHMEQTGKNVQVLHISTDRFMDDLGFRAGEFGNWVSDTERQKNLDMAYTSFKNLSDILGIDTPSLDGSLAIAFGARGRGGSGAAAAHYEPMRQVINLTKLSGAGCLAHEWGHALDHHLAQSLGLSSAIGMASDIWAKTATDKLPESFRDVMNAIHYTTSDESQYRHVKSNYVKDSEKFDQAYSKAGHGYWASDVELFARAFDCYIADKLKEAGIKDDYLSSKSDCYKMTKDNVTYHAYPTGAERVNINTKIDAFIVDMRERGILKSRVDEHELKNTKTNLTDVRAIVGVRRASEDGKALERGNRASFTHRNSI